MMMIKSTDFDFEVTKIQTPFFLVPYLLYLSFFSSFFVVVLFCCYPLPPV